MKTIDEPQLPSTIGINELDLYLKDDSWALSEKYDGVRLLVETFKNRGVTAYSRNGVERDFPGDPSILTDLKPGWIFDGEYIDGEYVVFDCLKTPRGSICGQPFHERYRKIWLPLKDRSEEGALLLRAPLSIGEQQKRRTLEQVRAAGGEGIVLSKLTAPYEKGRTKALRKFKFVSEVDCVITARGVGGKNNFELSLYDEGLRVPVGKVSALTGDGPKAKVGDVVTVQCLYVTASNKLYQPVKPKLRFDKTATQCTFDQLDFLKKVN
jgi:ATP-dependent DNA ligase